MAKEKLDLLGLFRQRLAVKGYIPTQIFASLANADYNRVSCGVQDLKLSHLRFISLRTMARDWKELNIVKLKSTPTIQLRCMYE